MTAPTSEPVSDELVMERVFDAPRKLVFQHWTEAAHIGAWFAPIGFRVTSVEVDARPGGLWSVAYEEETSGETITERGEFVEVVAPERLVFSLTHTFHETGRTGPRTQVSVRFIEHAGKTTMMFRQTGLVTLEMRNGNAEGWKGCFAKLDARIAAER